MAKVSLRLSSLPTREQELLLKASLLSGEACSNAWKAWNSRIDIENLDYGSNRLLPLAYHNLFQQGVRDPLMARLKSVYRYHLTQNHLMFHNIIPILRTFEERGMQTMLLKGSALTLVNYKNYGLRPQLDIDVLVRNDQAQHAFLYLKKAGWQPEFNYPLKKVLRFRHSCGFDAGPCKRLDLHWNIFEECRRSNADDIFWQRAVPVQLQDLTTRVLAPVDQFLHSCVHGIKWNTLTPIRWVADAMIVLLTIERPLDWAELIKQAQERYLTLAVRTAIYYLKDTFDAPIPKGVLEKMDKLPIQRYEQREFQIMTRRKSKIFGQLFKFTCGYRRLPRPKNFLRHVVLYPQYLQVQWKIKYIFLMPFQLIVDSIKSNIKRKKTETYGGHQ